MSQRTTDRCVPHDPAAPEPPSLASRAPVGPAPTVGQARPPLVAWVERGEAPDAVVGNDRPIGAYPHRAVYAGPAGGQNDPANWVRANFRRR
jgi:hypothetical protein